jgi:hypothetical protein
MCFNFLIILEVIIVVIRYKVSRVFVLINHAIINSQRKQLLLDS